MDEDSSPRARQLTSQAWSEESGTPATAAPRGRRGPLCSSVHTDTRMGACSLNSCFPPGSSWREDWMTKLLCSPWFGRLICIGALSAASAYFGAPALREGKWRAFSRPAAAKPANSSPRPTPPAVVYRKLVRDGVLLHVVQVDVTRPEVRVAVATARNGIGTYDTWSRMIDRTRPTAAVTGTYFCPDTAVPVGTIVAQGRTIHEGYVGTALALRHGRGPRLVTCSPGVAYDWSPFDTVLRAGPRLVTRGHFDIWPRGEGFRDPAISGLKKRAALGVTRSGKLILVAVEKPVRLGTLASLMHHAGAREAMCLDGGSSTGLFYAGKTRVKPRRVMTNLLVVYDSPARFSRYARALNPIGPQFASAPAQRF